VNTLYLWLVQAYKMMSYICIYTATLYQITCILLQSTIFVCILYILFCQHVFTMLLMIAFIGAILLLMTTAVDDFIN